jgi:hypothetical protein
MAGHAAAELGHERGGPAIRPATLIARPAALIARLVTRRLSSTDQLHSLAGPIPLLAVRSAFLAIPLFNGSFLTPHWTFFSEGTIQLYK